MPTPVIRSASSGADAQKRESRKLSPRERTDMPRAARDGRSGDLADDGGHRRDPDKIFF
jgi:hypothetical protein